MTAPSYEVSQIKRNSVHVPSPEKSLCEARSTSSPSSFSGEPSIDLEREAALMLRRESPLPGHSRVQDRAAPPSGRPREDTDDGPG